MKHELLYDRGYYLKPKYIISAVRDISDGFEYAELKHRVARQRKLSVRPILAELTRARQAMDYSNFHTNLFDFARVIIKDWEKSHRTKPKFVVGERMIDRAVKIIQAWAKDQRGSNEKS